MTRTRGIVLAAAVAAVAGVARGDAIVPRDPHALAVDAIPARGPIALEAELGAHSEHGCSQSFATLDVDGRMTLAIDAADRATLRLVGTSTSMIGPSESRFVEGGSAQIDRRSVAVAGEWRGRARRGPGALVIALDEPSHATLHCNVRASSVEGVKPSLPLLVCRVEPTLDIDSAHPVPATTLAFARGAGLRVSVRGDNPSWDERELVTFSLARSTRM